MKRVLNHSIYDIKGVIKELRNYQDELEEKRIIFIKTLMDLGISMANDRLGEFVGMVAFEKSIDEEGGVIVAFDREKIVRVWYTSKTLSPESKRSYEVSPLLLSEFGSGWLAQVASGVNMASPIGEVGQGTMPGQTHAFDTRGWFWYDEAGEKHHSYGEAPTHPLYHAVIEMQTQIDLVAREVYG